MNDRVIKNYKVIFFITFYEFIPTKMYSEKTSNMSTREDIFNSIFCKI
jgi:hypothetical protein